MIVIMPVRGIPLVFLAIWHCSLIPQCITVYEGEMSIWIALPQVVLAILIQALLIRHKRRGLTLLGMSPITWIVCAWIGLLLPLTFLPFI